MSSLSSSSSSPHPPSKLPDYIIQRNQLFEKLKSQYTTTLASKPRNLINITLDTTLNGHDDAAKSAALKVPATTWETTPGQLLKNLPKEISVEAVVAKVNDTLWDLNRPLEEEERDCKVSYLSIKNPEGRAVFWHSAAHLLGEAAEHQFGCMLSHGPPTATGFFYDMALEPGCAVKESDWPALEANVKKFSKEKQPFERLEVNKEDLRKLFGYSKYKMHFVEKFVPDCGSSTVYRNGDLVDLCLGPHIQNTKQISTFKIMSNGSAYFLGDQSNDSLQRVYGVAFPKAEQMKEWELFLKDAKARDHQEIGKQQKLFWFSQRSPGSPFLLPHGTRIFNAIQTMLREQYWERGYDEVQSPLMYDVELWKTSGHWQHYQDDMFRVPFKNSDPVAASSNSENTTATINTTTPVENKDKGIFGLKPMNCPGHCLMFASEERSYRTLPWRVADFSVLHRNEASGALSGMTRVRKFQQDDGHIFCTVDQVAQELEGMFDFMTNVYAIFGFPFKLKLSTRPDSYMGKLEDWDRAEDQLKQALQNFRGDNWVLNPGDGAFYGPKIDVAVNDAMGREFQCATIQLDFQLPQNFNLQYRASEAGPSAKSSEAQSENSLAPGMARPVMIHRAVIGSFDRFLAVICEHFAGKWPFWLSPRQIMVIPVMKEAEDYTIEVQSVFQKAKMYVDIDLSGNTLPKKIRNAQVAQYNFILVLGANERDNRAVNIRNRDDVATQKQGAMMQLDEALRKIKELRDERRLVNAIEM